MKPYYLRYDEHYRSLHSQGIQYWSDGPDHCQKNIQRVCGLLTRLVPDPHGRSLLDAGCGEGHLALPIANLGFEYTGIDVSPAAIGKARDRVAQRSPAPRFHVSDTVSGEGEPFQRQFDVVLDQSCFPMIVVDVDARRYLQNIHRVLRPQSLYLMLNQEWSSDAYDGDIASIEQYQAVFHHDLSKPKRWEAWHGGRWVEVTLPSFAGRPRRRESLVREVTRAGFEVCELHDNPNGHMLDLVLKTCTTTESNATSG